MAGSIPATSTTNRTRSRAGCRGSGAAPHVPLRNTLQYLKERQTYV